MNYLFSILLGMIQGITEFLPISSTAHLIIFTYLLKIPEIGLTFDVSLHLGTFLAIFIYFFNDWWEILKGVIKGDNKRKIFYYLIIGTMPAGIFGILLDPIVEKIAQPQIYSFSIPIIIIGLLSFGIIFMILERYSNKNLYITDLNWKRALIIGFWQVLSLFPGVSRSGSTISGGLFVGLRREESTKFSFLLSLPIILGALLLKSYQIYKGHISINYNLVLVGIFSSFIFGILSIHFLLSYVRKASLLIFSYYRFLLAFFLLIIFFVI